MYEYFEKTYQQLANTDEKFLRELRAQHWQKFLTQGLPTKKQEAWRHTDISALIQQPFELPTLNPQVTLETIQKYQISDTHLIVFINGHFSQALSQLNALPKEIMVTNLYQAAQRYPEKIEAYWQQFSLENLQHLNAALWQSGLFIEVPKGVSIEKPLHCLFISTAQTQPSIQSLRHLIVLHGQSQLTLLEHYVSETTHAALEHVALQIKLNADAKLHYVKSQQTGNQTYHIAHTTITQEKNSYCQATHIGLGAQLARDEITVHLQGENAHCQLNGLYVPQAQQHLDYHTEIKHTVSQGMSEEFYKGIIAEQGSAVFNGKIKVNKDTHKNSAQQKNNNLLLAKTGSIHTHPVLEIYADDVQCSHGATVGELDQDALFYLRARGVEEKTAKNILIEAFANEIVEKISPPMLQKFIYTQVQEKLAMLLD